MFGGKQDWVADAQAILSKGVLPANTLCKIPEELVSSEDGRVLARKNKALTVCAVLDLIAQGIAKRPAPTSPSSGVEESLPLKAIENIRDAICSKKDDVVKTSESIYDITTSIKVSIRSVFTCELRQGVCAKCSLKETDTCQT